MEYSDDGNDVINKTIISIKLENGKWLNTAMNVHNFSFGWFFDYSFTNSIIVIVMLIFVVFKIARPLDRLTKAIGEFSQDFKVSEVKEEGPSDLRKATKSFNQMQKNVAEHIEKRTKTLAAMSHDIRTPLTSLRLKTELLEESTEKESLILSIKKMEDITASALEYLKGNSRELDKKSVNLKVLIETECQERIENGEQLTLSNIPEAIINCDS